MPIFVGLLKLTDQGRRSIKDSPKRLREAISQFQKTFGIKLIHVYYTTGRYDIVTIHEAPDEQSALATLFAVESAGNATIETLNAYSVEEVEKIVSKLP